MDFEKNETTEDASESFVAIWLTVAHKQKHISKNAADAIDHISQAAY